MTHYLFTYTSSPPPILCLWLFTLNMSEKNVRVLVKSSSDLKLERQQVLLTLFNHFQFYSQTTAHRSSLSQKTKAELFVL